MHDIRIALTEVERELLVRQRVYPRLVDQGKLTQGEADRRTHALRLAIYYLEAATQCNGIFPPPTTTE
jgi:hypothetical protein